MKIPTDVMCFEDPKTGEVIILDWKNLLLYGKGEKYFELLPTNYSGDPSPLCESSEVRISYINPHNDSLDKYGPLIIMPLLIWNNRVFKKAYPPSKEIDVTQLPEPEMVEKRLFKRSDGCYVLLCKSKYGFRIGPVKLFVGCPNNLTEQKILRYDPSPIGTYIITDDLQYVFLAPTNKDKRKGKSEATSMWGTYGLKQLNADDYIIERNGPNIKIT